MLQEFFEIVRVGSKDLNIDFLQFTFQHLAQDLQLFRSHFKLHKVIHCDPVYKPRDSFSTEPWLILLWVKF